LEQLVTVLVVESLRVDGGDGGVHAPQPSVALEKRDPEGRVPHPQPGMASPIRVGSRATPVLLEEHPEPVFSA
jgi:hypothetical protein